MYNFDKGFGELEPAIWVSLKALRGQVFRIESLLPNYGALYDKLPIHAYVWHDHDDEGLPIDTNAAEVIPFRKVTNLLMEFEKAKVERKQLAKLTYQNIELRINKHILPYFGHMDILSINYKILARVRFKI